mmetsp:Transcript_19289/g.53529  ORF Transcript_19289/g.53529 Transcript_19289/m.53529 type:complete len:91 (+) Transcript_19289:788-1060(+)
MLKELERDITVCRSGRHGVRGGDTDGERGRLRRRRRDSSSGFGSSPSSEAPEPSSQPLRLSALAASLAKEAAMANKSTFPETLDPLDPVC